MFSNLINNRKASQDRAPPSGNVSNRTSSPTVTPDRIRHPHHTPPASQERDPSASYGMPGAAMRQNSNGSTSSAPWPPSAPQLPEELRERERLRQQEREHNRRSRQSSASAAKSSQDSSAKSSSNHMESSVTRLLVATKMLLEALTKWSLGQRSEEDVSDIYVRLGNDFNSAKLAFGSYGIDMTNLNSVPDDLRECLELCLSEEASPPVLELHLPRIREIIINLLQGLKMKQAEYKQFLVQQRAAKRQSSALQVTSVEAGHATSATSSSQNHSDASSANLTQSSQARDVRNDHPNQLKRASSATGNFAPSPILASQDADSVEAASPDPSGKSVMRPPSRVTRAVSEKMLSSSRDSFHAEQTSSTDSQPNSNPKEHAVDAETDHTTPRMPNIERHALTDPQEDISEDQVDDMLRSPMSHRTARSPRHASRPSIDVPGGTDSDPSMRALKNREALERRASKRFSAYTFNKMGVGTFNQGLGMNMFPSSATNSPMHDRKGAERRGSGARRLVRPSVQDSSPSSDSTSPLPLSRSTEFFSSGPPRSKSSATDNKIEAIEEVKTPTSATFPDNISSRPPSTDGASERSSNRARSIDADAGDVSRALGHKPTSHTDSSTDSLPFVDASVTKDEPAKTLQVDTDPTSSPHKYANAQAVAKSAMSPTALNVFLQVGRQTRKATFGIDVNAPLRGITIAKLRMLFVDKFAYSPGMEDFPSIYVKDAVSGVAYELEDLDDLEEGSILTLNIEPLDQVKQHLDLSLGVITRELRELKTSLAARDARRMSHGVVNVDQLAPPAVSQTPTKISDSQFQAAGQRVAQLKRADTRSINEEQQSNAGATTDIDRITERGASGSRIAQELKVQFEELQNLRREFAVTRQVQGDFETDVKLVLSTMREQAAKVREIASTKVAAERNFIIAGKTKLDSSSQDLLTLIEDLQDTVDDLKMDVISRGVKPKPALVKQIVEDIDKATAGLLGLEQYVQTVKPSWKKTWETELQNIVDEQEFLNHEEGLMSDLRDDLSGLTEVFSNIQQVVKLRGGSGKGGKYIPPLPEQGFGGLSTVMMEVKGQAVNHEKRLRALQAVERQRQKDILTNKPQDEFTEELAGFVDKKVLRKTGGVLEAERVRQKRDHATWKAMFGGGGAGGAPVPSTSGQAPDILIEKPKKLVLGKKQAPPNIQ